MTTGVKPKDVMVLLPELGKLVEAALGAKMQAAGMETLLGAHARLLSLLYGEPEPVPTKDLVARLGRAKSSVTGMLNTLEKSGCIERRPNPSDARVTDILLSPEGRLAAQGLAAAEKACRKRLYRGLRKQDRRKLVKLLARVAENLGG